jgi:hypothetical protein
MKPSPSTALLTALVHSDAAVPARDPSHAVLPSFNVTSARPVTVHLPSRYIPVAAAMTCLSTIFGCVLSNRWHKHDVGGIPWPYISDTAKDAPQAGAFAFGMTVTACLVVVIVVLHYGKLKNDLSVLHDSKGMRRNKLSMICGLVAAPNLALLACYDTARTPGLHMLFVLGFFPACVVYLFAVTSLYKLIVHDMRTRRCDDDSSVTKTRWISLRTSLKYKVLICNCFLVSVSLYLPIGLCLVSNWYNYAEDVYVHTMRAISQHISVALLVLFFVRPHHPFLAAISRAFGNRAALRRVVLRSFYLWPICRCLYMQTAIFEWLAPDSRYC